MSNQNPYVTVASPSYAAPILDWQGMLNPQQKKQGGNMGPNGQPQPGQPGAPGQPGQPTQAQQQAQGLGARLAQMFNMGGQQQPGQQQPGQPMNINPPPPQMQGPTGPPMQGPWMGPQGPQGIY